MHEDNVDSMQMAALLTAIVVIIIVAHNYITLIPALVMKML